MTGVQTCALPILKSVGEVMAIGRSFTESLGKAMRGLETDSCGFDKSIPDDVDEERFLQDKLAVPRAERLWWIGEALRAGWTEERVFDVTHIDPWFIREIATVIGLEQTLSGREVASLSPEAWLQAKREGISDMRLAQLMGSDELSVRRARQAAAVNPVFKRVDTCAAEFEAHTPYLYSSYEIECEARPSDKKKIMVLGGGPNRIGQGIEFDYCCVHAAFALSEDGFETIMVNCNPETVSTDYDTSDRLYFEPVTFEDVMAIVDIEKPDGVIVQYGGQTPLKLAESLQVAGVPIIGTSPDMIDLAEDRERFQKLLHELDLKQPENGTARSTEEAVQVADEIGYPVVVRPSYVLGGRAMQIVHDQKGLLRYMNEAVQASPDHPVLLDRFLNSAIELDVDALADGNRVVIGGIMEHIEEAGVHSGDSACSLPPYILSKEIQGRLREQTRQIAIEMQAVGLMNILFAIQGEDIYLLEVNPRASRTVPFVSKATGVPLAKIAARCMVGQSLAEQGVTEEVVPDGFAGKESVFPFVKFPGVDPLLGPEMKSTGEVMGLGKSFGMAFAKAQLGAGVDLPTGGNVFISVRGRDRDAAVELGRELVGLGFNLVVTKGTGRSLQEPGIECEMVNKVYEGRPHIVDMIKNDEISLIINTTEGKQAIADSYTIRASALQGKVSYTTTIAGAQATCRALNYLEQNSVTSLQVMHAEILEKTKKG